MSLLNLGLGEGSALPVGVPIPYPLTTPPIGWFNCNGALFDKVQYPKLALVYPSGILPDLRGEFIRGWDNGRGVDNGRSILSKQDGTWIQPNIESNEELTAIQMGNGENVFNNNNNHAVSGLSGFGVVGSRARWYIRPRNIAFNYIVRAV